jgi:CBS domain-containing protein
MCHRYPLPARETPEKSMERREMASKSGIFRSFTGTFSGSRREESESEPRGEIVAEKIQDVMTREPATVTAEDTALDAAKAMRDGDFGAVVVVNDGGEARGILTDRDIVVRCIADDKLPAETKVSEVFTTEPTTLSPEDSLDDAVDSLREANVRRLPVVEDGRVVGIVSIGDLAEARDEKSALADISSAAPNN